MEKHAASCLVWKIVNRTYHDKKVTLITVTNKEILDTDRFSNSRGEDFNSINYLQA